MFETKKKQFGFKDSVNLTLIYILGIQLLLPVVVSIAFSFRYASYIQKVGVLQFEKEFGGAIAFTVFFLASVWLLFVTRHKLWAELKKFTLNLSPNFVKVLKNFGIATLINMGVNIVLMYIFKIDSDSQNQQSIESLISSSMMLMAIVTVVFAPFVEEIVFRGGLYLGIRDMIGESKAALISALSFGAIHVLPQFFASGELKELLFLATYSVLGYFMVKSVKDTGSLWGGISFHFLQNLIATVLVLTSLKG